MTDNFAHLNVDDDEFESAPRALRDAYKKLQKAYGSAEQTITELRDTQTSTALSGVLAGFKNPERVKSAMLSDKIDPLDSEAVQAWLGDNGDDYAKAPDAPAAPATETPQVPDYGQLNAPSEMGDPAAYDAQLQAVLNAPKDMSPQELVAYFAAKGI